MIRAALNHLFFASLMAGVLILAILAARTLLRPKVGNRVIYAAWLLVALRLLMPVTLPVPAETAPTVADQPIYAVFGDPATAPRTPRTALSLNTDAGEPANAQTTDQIAPSAEQENLPSILSASVDTTRLLFFAWLGGTALCAMWMACQNLWFRCRLRYRRMTKPEALAVRAAFARIGMKQRRVRVGEGTGSAFLMGAYRPLIVLPNAIFRQDASALDFALLHEACHARGGDTRWALLRNALCCVYWFHPLVWLAARASRADAELACDERVTVLLDDGERLDYARALVDAQARVRPMTMVATGVPFSGAKLRARVEWIVKEHKMKRWLKAAASMALIAVMVATFAVAAPAEKGLEAYESWILPEMSEEEIEEMYGIIREAMDLLALQDMDLNLTKWRPVFEACTEEEKGLYFTLMNHFELYEDNRIGLTPEDDWERFLTDLRAMEDAEDFRRVLHTDYAGINQGLPGQPTREDVDKAFDEAARDAGFANRLNMDPAPRRSYKKFTYYGGWTPHWAVYTQSDESSGDLTVYFTPDLKVYELYQMPFSEEMLERAAATPEQLDLAKRAATGFLKKHGQQRQLTTDVVKLSPWTYSGYDYNSDPLVFLWVHAFSKDAQGNEVPAYVEGDAGANYGCAMMIGGNTGRIYQYGDGYHAEDPLTTEASFDAKVNSYHVWKTSYGDVVHVGPSEEGDLLPRFLPAEREQTDAQAERERMFYANTLYYGDFMRWPMEVKVEYATRVMALYPDAEFDFTYAVPDETVVSENRAKERILGHLGLRVELTDYDEVDELYDICFSYIVSEKNPDHRTYLVHALPKDPENPRTPDMFTIDVEATTGTVRGVAQAPYDAN